MSLKLEKTYLSRKLPFQSFFVGLLSVLFLLMVFSMDHDDLWASPHKVFIEGQYWRAFTATLMHADLGHLGHNSFFFFGLSFLLHAYFGPLIFPFLSFLAGALINLITLNFYAPNVHLVGVSGVVYFMASFWLSMFVLIERRHSFIKRLLYALGMALIFLFPQTFRPEVSYLAHATGFFLGIPMAVIYFCLNFKKIRGEEIWRMKAEVPMPEELNDIESTDQVEGGPPTQVRELH